MMWTWTRVAQPGLAALAFIASLFAGSVASAQTYTVTITGGTMALGTVASGPSGNTNFVINPSTGAVTVASGAGSRVSSSSARATVTIACGNQNSCDTTSPFIRIGATGSPTGRADPLTSFTMANGTGTLSGAITGSSPIDFRLVAIPRNSSRTIHVGATYPVEDDNSPQGTGDATSGFYVWARATSPPSAGATGSATSTVYRRISISKTSDISFGRIVRPTTGSATIGINASDGARTVGTAVALATPTPTRAAYTVTGESGRTFSVSLSPFTMTGPPGGSLTVTPTHDAGLSPVLTGGTFSFNAGASFILTSTTPGGSYSGSFDVTVVYN